MPKLDKARREIEKRVAGLEERKTQVRILCFKFSLNPLRFSLTREIVTKMTMQVQKLSKVITIGKIGIFGQFCHSRIKVLLIAQLLGRLVIFVSVSLVRGNLRGLRETDINKAKVKS